MFLSGEQAAAGFALINSLGAVGGFIGPSLVGLLTDRGGGFAPAMLVLAAFLVVAGCLILAFPAPGRREPQLLASVTCCSSDADIGGGGDDDCEAPGDGVGQGGSHRLLQQGRRSRGGLEDKEVELHERQPILADTCDT